MKSKKEIKLEFFKQFGDESFRGYSLEQCHSIWEFFEKYIQCQEDMADKKYTEADMLNCWNYLMVAMTSKNPVFFKDYINSLNKQDLPIINGSYGCTIETSKNKQN